MHYKLQHSNSSSSSPKFSSQFLGAKTGLQCVRTFKIGPSNGSKTQCWFRFAKNGVDAENAGIYGSQTRDDFDRDDIEEYFNYMGMLAVDIMLMLAASECDKQKIEELLRAGANYTVKDANGRTALDRAAPVEIKDFILSFSVQKA